MSMIERNSLDELIFEERRMVTFLVFAMRFAEDLNNGMK
jgi:hypothetical protein